MDSDYTNRCQFDEICFKLDSLVLSFKEIPQTSAVVASQANEGSQPNIVEK